MPENPANPESERIMDHLEVPKPLDIPLSEIPDEEEGIARILADARKQMDEIKALMQPLQNEQKSAAKRAEELIRQAREQEAAAKKFEVAMWDAQKAMRKIEQTALNAEKKANRLKAIKAFEKQQAELANEFDMVTAGAPWREWAKDHQIKGMHHLAQAGSAILADAPRFGKTLTVLGTCDMLQSKRILFLTKSTIVGEIEKQVYRWAPHRAAVFNLAGKSKLQRNTVLDIVNILPDVVVVMNYEAWVRDDNLLERLIDARFDTVIIDEAHEVNNTQTSRFKGIKRIVTAKNDLAPKPCSHCRETVNFNTDVIFGGGWIDKDGSQQCILNETYPNWHEAPEGTVRHVYPMTGTVIINKPQDLFALLNLVSPKEFPTLWEYERQYLTQNSYTGKWEFKYGGLDRLTRKLADKYLRRDRNNSPEIDLPAPEIVVRELSLNSKNYPKQWKVCQDLNRAILEIAEDTKIGIDYAITLILRKRQAVTWPHFTLKDDEGVDVIKFEVDESIKIDECIRYVNSGRDTWEGMIPELVESGEKVALASQFKLPLREISRRLTLAGIKHITIDGDTPISQRNAMVDDFNNPDSDTMVCLGNYKAMGTGITLGGANEMIILDEEWSAAKNDQMYDRLVVMGKEQKCQVTILRVQDSIDKWMQNLIQQKRDMQDGFNEKSDLAADLLAQIKSGLL